MIEDPTLSRNVLEMATVASEYCHFIENISGTESRLAFDTLSRFLPLLYLRGTLLPDIIPEYPEANERYVTEEQWDNVFMDLRALFDQQDEFIYVGENEFGEPASLNGSISEHLADIYQDLKDFVWLYKKANPAMRENAIAGCKELFATHWGPRLASLMPVVHRQRYSGQGSFESDFPDLF